MKKERLIKEQALEWLNFKKKHVSQSSFARYESVVYKNIIPDLGELNVSDIESNLSLLKEKIKEYGYSKKTSANIITIFNSIMKFSTETDLYPKKSEENEEEEMKIIPKDQFELFMEEVKTDIDQTKIGILCVIYAGLKIGELCSLRWRDIDLNNCVIKVNKTLQRISLYDKKEGKTVLKETEISPRYIPIPTKLLRILLTHSGRLDDYVLSGNSKQIEPRTAQHRLSAVCRRIGLYTKINYTKLRDYFAVNAISNGVNILVVAEILGLEYNGMEKYASVAKEHMDKEMEVEKLNLI